MNIIYLSNDDQAFIQLDAQVNVHTMGRVFPIEAEQRENSCEILRKNTHRRGVHTKCNMSNVSTNYAWII